MASEAEELPEESSDVSETENTAEDVDGTQEDIESAFDDGDAFMAEAGEALANASGITLNETPSQEVGQYKTLNADGTYSATKKKKFDFFEIF